MPARTGLEAHLARVGQQLADGVLELTDRTIRLEAMRAPVLSVAGSSDVLAPPPAVHAVGDLLPTAAEVRLETGPGGHLGVLTGRSAKRTTWVYIDEFFARHGSPAHGTGEPARRHLRVVA